MLCKACRILLIVPQLGIEPTPMHWRKADSYVLDHQGSPTKPFLSAQFSGVKYIHTVVQPSPLSICRTLSTF